MRRLRLQPAPARRVCRRPRPASAVRPGAHPDARRDSGSRLLLHDERAVQAGHVLPAHLGRLANRVDRLRLPLDGRAMTLDDLIAALAVNLVSLDVDREKFHLALGEAVVRLERREVALVDARYLGLESD